MFKVEHYGWFVINVLSHATRENEDPDTKLFNRILKTIPALTKALGRSQ